MRPSDQQMNNKKCYIETKSKLKNIIISNIFIF